MYLKEGDLRSQTRLAEKIKELCPHHFCRVTGQNAAYLEISNKVVSTLLDSFVVSLSLVLMALMLIAHYFGIREKIAIAYSAVWGPVAMLFVIAIFQVPVSIVTSLFAAVIVGITGDNAIQYMFATKNSDLRSGIDDRGDGTVFLSFLLAAGSCVFFFQSVKPLQILGLLFFIGFIVNLAGDLWLLKGALPALEEKPEKKN